MYQNSRLKSPKTSTCLFVKKCHNSCLELGNIKLMTLYLCACLGLRSTPVGERAAVPELSQGAGVLAGPLISVVFYLN